MSGNRVRITVTPQQFAQLRREVFSDLRLSTEQRRKEAKRIVPLPPNGKPIDLYYDEKFVGTL